MWRRDLPGRHDAASIAVDSHGAILVPSATLPELVQLTPDGIEQWRASTGDGPAVTGVVLLNDETRVVVTSADEAFGFSPSGQTRFRTTLRLSERNAEVHVLPLEDGGLALGSAFDVLELESDGTERGRTHLDARIDGPLVLSERGVVAITQNGTVYAVGEGFARRLGSFGGSVGDAGAATPDGRHLVAVVDALRPRFARLIAPG